MFFTANNYWVGTLLNNNMYTVTENKISGPIKNKFITDIFFLNCKA